MQITFRLSSNLGSVAPGLVGLLAGYLEFRSATPLGLGGGSTPPHEGWRPGIVWK